MTQWGTPSAFRTLERIVKGIANAKRITILDLLKRVPELSVEDIATELNFGYENTSDHIRKLAIAGLVMKRSDGKAVRHKLTSRGELILTFCKRLE